MYVQLYEQIECMIKNGDIQPGAKLPAIRELSKLLGINAVTVVKAYELLEAGGSAFSKPGSGTYVSQSARASAMQEYMLPRGDVIDFANFTPSPELFPVQQFKTLINEVLDRDAGKAFEYQDSRGYPPLREALSYYVGKSGIKANSDDIQVISGAQQGIDVLAKALAGFGDSIIMESPSYTGAIAAFRSRNIDIIGIPMQGDGLDTEMLEKRVREKRPSFIYVMTDFHNPTGVSYSLKKRERLLHIAERYDVYIVEDDYLSELNFSGEIMPSLKSMDKSDHVIYIKSFSKILMPGLRLGFMILPARDDLYQKVLNAKQASDISTSGLMQRVLELYLKRDLWRDHISLIYKEYKNRYDCIINALERYMPEQIKYHRPGGGMHIWCTMPQGCRDEDLYDQALKMGVAFAPGSAFYPFSDVCRCFKLSFASTDAGQIEAGIMALGKAAADYIERRYKKNYGRYAPLL